VYTTDRIVSSGYEARPAPIVTPQPRRKDAKKEPSRAPTRTTGSTTWFSSETREGGGLVLTERVVNTEVKTTVHDDTNNRRNEAAVKTGNTVRSQGLTVDVHEAVELTSSTANLCRLRIVRETRTSVVEGVDKQKGRGTSCTTGCNVARKPLPVALVLLEAEQGLEVVLCNGGQTGLQSVAATSRTEGEVERLGGEVTDNVGGVATPERDKAFILVGAAEAVGDTLVGRRETALLDHLILVLNEELNALNGGCGSLRDSGGDTTHQEVG
jgi:hypothetical protein